MYTLQDAYDEGLCNLHEVNNSIFTKLYNSHHKDLSNFCISKLEDDTDRAKELAHEVWVQMYNYLCPPKNIKDLSAIMIHRAKDRIKNILRDKKPKLNIQKFINIFATEKTPESLHIEKEQYESLYDEIDQLKDNWRIALNYRLDNKPYSEIALEMNTTVESAKKFKQRAEKRLKEIFDSKK